jgi:hypothetical protein
VGLGASRNGIENLPPPAFDSLTSLHVRRYPDRHSYCGTQTQGRVLFSAFTILLVHVVGQLDEALHYKPEGSGSDSRWSNWNFLLT